MPTTDPLELRNYHNERQRLSTHLAEALKTARAALAELEALATDPDAHHADALASSAKRLHAAAGDAATAAGGLSAVLALSTLVEAPKE